MQMTDCDFTMNDWRRRRRYLVGRRRLQSSRACR